MAPTQEIGSGEVAQGTAQVPGSHGSSVQTVTAEQALMDPKDENVASADHTAQQDSDAQAMGLKSEESAEDEKTTVSAEEVAQLRAERAAVDVLAAKIPSAYLDQRTNIYHTSATADRTWVLENIGRQFEAKEADLAAVRAQIPLLEHHVQHNGDFVQMVVRINHQQGANLRWQTERIQYLEALVNNQEQSINEQEGAITEQDVVQRSLERRLGEANNQRNAANRRIASLERAATAAAQAELERLRNNN